MADQPPQNLYQEIAEIYADLAAEVVEGEMIDTDPEVMAFLSRVTLQCMTRENPDMMTAVSRLATAMLWMMQVGREHHARGYDAPITRTRSETAIPDYIVDMFKNI